MKYWRGYLTAVIFLAFSLGLKEFAQNYPTLIDMVYPYVTRTFQGLLAGWTGTVDFLVWQILLLLFVVFVLVSLILMIIWRRNIVQWLGWVLALVSVVYCLHTGIYGLNYYAGDLATDIKLDHHEYTVSELERITIHYRGMANALARQVRRDENGVADFQDFETLAQQNSNGFRNLVLDYKYPVFGGDYATVKKLGWADVYTSMGINGFTCFLTGEPAVNPQIPEVVLPFTMAHELSHQICIADETDANFAAFLACMANESIEYQYSAYFMAYRYCYNTLAKLAPSTAAEVRLSCSPELQADLDAYSDFYATRKDETASRVADTVNDTYLKTSGDEEGIASYGQVTDLLVDWYMFAINVEEVVEEKFDPFDETQVDLTTTRVEAGKNEG